MRRLLALAHNTWREAIRNQTLGVLLIFAALLLLITPTFGTLSLDARRQTIADLGLFGIVFFSHLIAVFLAIDLPQNDLTRGTASLLFATGVTPGEWLAGKFLGIVSVVLVVDIGMGFCLFGFLALNGVPLDRYLLQSVVIMAAEGVLLAGVALLLGTLVPRLPALFLVIGFFLLGHVGEDLRLAFSQEGGLLLTVGSEIAYLFLPHLELFSVGRHLSWTPPVTPRFLFGIVIYAVAYATACVSAATLCLRRRDL